MSNLVKEFKDFIAQGNFIDLAIGVLIGGAFAPVVGAFVSDFIMNIIAGIFGQPDFSTVGFNVGDSRAIIGTTINALITFVVIMLVAFLIIKAYNRLRKAKDDEAAGPTEVELLTEIRDQLRAPR
jgi:large conductance mechanosensitive channel